MAMHGQTRQLVVGMASLDCPGAERTWRGQEILSGSSTPCGAGEEADLAFGGRLVQPKELETERLMGLQRDKRDFCDSPRRTKSRQRKIPRPGAYPANYSPFRMVGQGLAIGKSEARLDLQAIIDRSQAAFQSTYFEEDISCETAAGRPKPLAVNREEVFRGHRRRIRAPTSRSQENKELQAALKASLQDTGCSTRTQRADKPLMHPSSGVTAVSSRRVPVS